MLNHEFQSRFLKKPRATAVKHDTHVVIMGCYRLIIIVIINTFIRPAYLAWVTGVLWECNVDVTKTKKRRKKVLH